MKIILFGARGWIGSQILQLLQQEPNLNVICPLERADNVADVAHLLDTEQPDSVISIIGRTRGPGIGTIDYLEDSDKSHDKLTLNMRDNLYAPLSLAIACQSRGIHFCYLGTGCIFSYSDDKTVFDEDDEPNFFGSGYSVVKGYTDRLMHQFPNVLQARIRMPLTPDNSPFNFITKITSYYQICSFENSMTVLPTLLPLLVDMIKNGTCGTINLTNPGTICHDRILTLYKEIVDPNFTWKNFTIEQQDALLLSKRSNNHL
jgi:3,5-epimerase/4-reductase